MPNYYISTGPRNEVALAKSYPLLLGYTEKDAIDFFKGMKFGIKKAKLFKLFEITPPREEDIVILEGYKGGTDAPVKSASELAKEWF